MLVHLITHDDCFQVFEFELHKCIKQLVLNIDMHFIMPKLPNVIIRNS